VAARTPSSGKHRRDQRREHLFRTRMCRPDRWGGVACSRHRQRQSGLEGPPSPPRSPFKAHSVRRGPMKVAFARSHHIKSEDGANKNMKTYCAGCPCKCLKCLLGGAGAHLKNDSPRCKEKSTTLKRQTQRDIMLIHPGLHGPIQRGHFKAQ